MYTCPTPSAIKTARLTERVRLLLDELQLLVWEGARRGLHFRFRLVGFLHVLLVRSTGDVVVRLLSREIQHQGVGLVSYGNGAGPLGPRLPVYLHRHHGALQDQLMLGNSQTSVSPNSVQEGASPKDHPQPLHPPVSHF